MQDLTFQLTWKAVHHYSPGITTVVLQDYIALAQSWETKGMMVLTTLVDQGGFGLDQTHTPTFVNQAVVLLQNDNWLYQGLVSIFEIHDNLRSN